jgi:hypothetical protein
MTFVDVLTLGRGPGLVVIPGAKMIMTPEFGHNAPDLGAPKTVADLIRA